MSESETGDKTNGGISEREIAAHPMPWHDEGILRQEYVRKGRSPEQIAKDEKIDCHPSTIRRWVRRHGLQEVRDGDHD